MATFLFKIKFGNTLRRLNVHQRYNSSGPDLTFNKLEAKIRQMFQIGSANQLLITYTDRESDVVTMGGDQDLEDACVFQGLNTIRLEVKIVDGKQRASYVTAPIDTGSNRPARQTAETKLALEWDSFLRTALPNLTPDVVKQFFKAYEPFIKAAPPFGTISEMLEGLVKAMTKPGPPSFTDPPTTVTAATSDDAKEPELAITSFSPGADNIGTTDPEICGRRVVSDSEIVGRIFHRGVQCDECGVTPIVGPRFKSIKEDDYDLCYSCFLNTGSEADYQKIDRPIHAPRNHYHPTCGPRMGMMHPHMGSPVGRPLPPAVPMGPPFKPFFPRGCCGWKNEFQVRSSTPVTGNGIGEQTGGKLDARFVRDVTIFDGTELAPGTNFTKIWRLRNIGSLHWPWETQLVFVGGDLLGLDSPVNLELPEQGLPPDEEIEASVDLVAPERPGRYVSHWRLMVPSGQKFGHRVWVLIQVVPKDEQSPQVQKSLRPVQVFEEESKSKLEINMAEEKLDVAVVSSNKMDVALELVDEHFSELKPKNPVSAEQQLEQGETNDDSLGTVKSEVGGFSIVEKPIEVGLSVEGVLSPRQLVDSPISDYVNISGSFDQNQGVHTEQPARESDLFEKFSLNVSGFLPELPIADEQQHAEELDMSSVREGVKAIFEATLLEQLESMGFNKKTLNYELLKKNKNDLQSTIEDLVAVAEWDPILVELEGMGFVDKEMNLRLMFKNNGSVKRVVKELVQMQVLAGKASAIAAAVKSKEKAL